MKEDKRYTPLKLGHLDYRLEVLSTEDRVKHWNEGALKVDIQLYYKLTECMLKTL